MSDIDVRAAAAPKSDQINSDDLIGASLTVKVTAVKAGSKEQPIIIEHDGGKPYKPCKGMIRVLMLAWTDKAANWVGKSMTLFNDPTVRWAGIEVGGIRISHLSDIKHSIDTSVTISKGQRKPYRVDPLKVEAPEPKPAYPPAQFDEKLPKMRQAIADGKMDADEVIATCEKTGTLTEEQKKRIRAPIEAPTTESEEENFG